MLLLSAHASIMCRSGAALSSNYAAVHRLLLISIVGIDCVNSVDYVDSWQAAPIVVSYFVLIRHNSKMRDGHVNEAII